MKKILFKVMLLLTLTSMVISLMSCGKTPTDSNVDTSEKSFGDKKIELLVDLHGWMPTLNTEPTVENPTVFLSPQIIADNFMDEYPNITIKWARSKPVGGLRQELAEWFTTQINAGRVPAIAFSWGTAFQDRGWYLELDEYLDKPNPYIEGNKKWRDIFPDYLWSLNSVVCTNGNALAIPIALHPGPPTGYYYNVEAFNELNLSEPKTWEQFFDVSRKLKEAGYTAVAPWGFFNKIEMGSWVSQFSIGPAYAANLMDRIDYDGDGAVSSIEQVRATKEGYFNPLVHDYAKEVYQQIKRYYNEILPLGWENIDFMALWNDGNVGMKQEGLWALQHENNNKGRAFEFSVFPAPIVSKDTSNNVADIEFTEKGPYRPAPDLLLNIMKSAVEGDKAKLDAAVKFLQYLTTPENITAMVQEMGSSIGAVRGSDVPPILSDWLDKSFAKIPNAGWPGGFTDEYNIQMDATLEMWVKGQMNDDDFFNDVHRIQQQGADDYMTRMGIDTTGWNISN